MILYFTGTGNSKYIAEKIAKETSDNLFSINLAIKNNDFKPLNTNEKVILVVPTYAWRIPRIVYEFLLKVDLNGAKKIYFVMNCGSKIGAASKYNKELAIKKGLKYMGTSQIIMPENYIAMFNTPSEKEAKSIIDKAEKNIKDVIVDIKSNNELPTIKSNILDHLMSGFTNKVFYPLFVSAKAFKVSDECINCGLCEKLCPLNNIKIKNNKPFWGNNCTHCMACISYCPKKAIEYGNKSEGKRRYHL